MAKSLRQQGHSNIEIARLLGVTAQHVSYMFGHTRRELGRMKRRAQIKKTGAVYRCSVCGEKGHNAQRHDHYRPEDLKTIRQAP